jgi:hypothetical protein
VPLAALAHTFLFTSSSMFSHTFSDFDQARVNAFPICILLDFLGVAQYSYYHVAPLLTYVWRNTHPVEFKLGYLILHDGRSVLQSRPQTWPAKPPKRLLLPPTNKSCGILARRTLIIFFAHVCCYRGGFFVPHCLRASLTVRRRSRKKVIMNSMVAGTPRNYRATSATSSVWLPQIQSINR